MLKTERTFKFFSSSHVLLVFVNPRPANCDSLMELGQGSTSAIFLSVSRGMLKTSEFLWPQNISECYFWSFRGVSCILRTILFSIFFDNFYNAFFQRRLVHNDGLDSVCQNSSLRCRQNEFSTLRFAQVFNEFDNAPSSISFYLSLLLLRWSLLKQIKEIEKKMFCLPCVRVYVHLLHVLFLLIPAQLLHQSNDLVLDPRKRWIAPL